MNIAAYDHGGGQFAEKLKKAVEDLTKQFPESKVILKILRKIGDLNNFSIAIVHPSETEWEDLITNSEPGKVRIRVSTDPLNAPTVSCKHNGVYVLNLLKKAPDVSVAEWKCILEGIQKKDILEELLRGGNPQGLRPYFIKDSEPVILVALSILCQGYLSVHAEYAGSDKNWKDEELRPALKQMGWYALKDGPNQSLIPNNLANKIGTVRNADWWLGVFNVFDEKNEQKKQIVEEKRDAFEKGLKAEWNELKNGKVPDEVSQLIKLFHKQENVNRPDWVPEAYCAIAERLGE